MIGEILQDALFAAIAAIGFAAISRPPRRAYLWCALIAAVGHKAFGGLAMCVLNDSAGGFDRYFSLFAQNAIVCLCILLGMVVGATLPIFIFAKTSFRATRKDSGR